MLTSLPAWTLAGVVLTAVLILVVHRSCHRRGGRLRLGVADWLTALRLALIAPSVWFLATGRYLAGAICYVLLALTDIADGVIARRRNETTPFGVILDPLADILSTFAVFTALVLQGLVPWWLYALLTFRYLMLSVGSLLLMRYSGPIEFQATLPGKIVGVLQAGGILWILLSARAGTEPSATDGPLFAFLGLGFLSIVVSQAIIGYRHVRRAPRA